MKSALNFLFQLDEGTVRSVHDGEVSRSVLSHTAEEFGFPKSAGIYAHRLIRAHENVEAFIAFYLDGVSHAMDAADAPEVDVESELESIKRQIDGDEVDPDAGENGLDDGDDAESGPDEESDADASADDADGENPDADDRPN